jgi:hypothetical protein
MSEPIPDYGDLMTLDNFIHTCKNGCFNDYDGFGNYSDGEILSDIEVSPSDILHGNIRYEWTHVVWFNK